MLNADIAKPEREALALVWACERFHLYVYREPKFDLVTAHEALKALGFAPSALQLASLLCVLEKENCRCLVEANEDCCFKPIPGR